MSKALGEKKVSEGNGDYSTRKKYIEAKGKGILDLAILIGAAMSLGFGIRTIIYGVQHNLFAQNAGNIILVVLLIAQAVGVYFSFSCIVPFACGVIGVIATLVFKLSPGPIIIITVVYCLIVTGFAEVLWKKYKNNSICS